MWNEFNTQIPNAGWASVYFTRLCRSVLAFNTQIPNRLPSETLCRNHWEAGGLQLPAL